MAYWHDREVKHMASMDKLEATTAKRLQKNYKRAMADIESKIDSFYANYATKEGISMQQAIKKINKTDVSNYKDLADQYVKERNFSRIANERLRLYNVTMRINRLEYLKKNIELDLLALASGDENAMDEILTDSALAEFKRQSGVLGQTLEFGNSKLSAIVNSSFLTATWSTRVWNNLTALRTEIERLLENGITQGLHSRELARQLRKTLEVSEFNAERLMVTEMARVRADIFKDATRQAGYKAYVYIAEPSACDICKELHDEVFLVKDMEIGVNMFPMHPFCKCSTASFSDRKELEDELAKLGL